MDTKTKSLWWTLSRIKSPIRFFWFRFYRILSTSSRMTVRFFRNCSMLSRLRNSVTKKEHSISSQILWKTLNEQMMRKHCTIQFIRMLRCSISSSNSCSTKVFSLDIHRYWVLRILLQLISQLCSFCSNSSNSSNSSKCNSSSNISSYHSSSNCNSS